MKTKQHLLEAKLRKMVREELGKNSSLIKEENSIEPYAFRNLASSAKSLSAVLVSVANSKNNADDINVRRDINQILRKLRQASELIEDAALEMSKLGHDSTDRSEDGAPTSR